MTDAELLQRFASILEGILFTQDIRLAMETERADVDGWDSFAYVNFIVAVEMELGIKFRVADVESFRTVGDIVRETQRLVAAKD